MNNPRCKICLEVLGEGEAGYHASCCRTLFGGPHPPHIPHTWKDLNRLAEQIVRAHVAVPGVQPKLSLHLERGSTRERGRFTLVGLGGDYILKPPVERFPQMPELEHLTMRMAGCFGIETADCGLVALEDGKAALLVRRMDRVDGRKLPMEDMCQLTDRLTEEKYRGSLESVGKEILRHCSNPGWDALRFFEVNVFCFLTGNSDMHLKNFSLIRSPGGEIRLSPAYDLLPTALLLPEETEETALTLQGRKTRLNRRDFLGFGGALRLTERQIANSLRRFEAGLASAIALVDQGFCSKDRKDRFKILLENRWHRLKTSA